MLHLLASLVGLMNVVYPSANCYLKNLSVQFITDSSSVNNTSLSSLSLWMGSLFGDWPSYDPHNFSQLRPSDPAIPSKVTPATYHPTHNRTVPPPNQVISTEATNILLRQFYQRAEEKTVRPKRAASENLTPNHGCKQPKGSFGYS